MIRLGLTGSYATGKSTVASIFKREGVAFFDADKAAHDALQHKPIISAIAKKFPSAVAEGKVNRKTLGSLVFSDAAKLAWLEALTHPYIFEQERIFITRARLRGATMTLSEIPLMFETGADKRYDYTISTTAPLATMELRALKRPGMTSKKFKEILSCQMPSQEKCKRADFVIHTGIGKAYTYSSVKEILNILRHPHA